MIVSISRSDVLWNYAGLFFRLGVNFFILPLLMAFLTEDSLGLWYVFVSIGSFTALFQLGFSPALARNIAYCVAGAKTLNVESAARSIDQRDEISWPLFANVILVSKKMYRLIALLALVIMLSAGSFYISVIGSSVDGALGAWLLYSFGAFLNLYYLYYESLLRGIGSIASVNKATVLSVVIQLIVVWVCFFFNLGIFSPVVGYVTQGVIFRFSCSKYFWSNHVVSTSFCIGDLNRYSDRALQRSLYRIISPNAYRDGIVSLSNYLATQANTIICSSFISLAQAGMFSVASQIVNAVASVASAYINACHPQLQMLYARSDYSGEERLIEKASSSFVITYLFGSALVGFAVLPILGIIRESYAIDFPFYVLMVGYYFIWKVGTNFAAFISNHNTIPYVKAFIISSILGVLLSIFFVTALDAGVWGLVIGQLISQVIYNFWKWPEVVAGWFNKNTFVFFIDGIKLWLKG